MLGAYARRWHYAIEGWLGLDCGPAEDRRDGDIVARNGPADLFENLDGNPRPHHWGRAHFTGDEPDDVEVGLRARGGDGEIEFLHLAGDVGDSAGFFVGAGGGQHHVR